MNATQTLLINIDEVPIQLDLGANRTYHPKGAKMIEIKKTTGSRIMCTALLGVLSNGFKLPIYLVTKSGKDIQVPNELKPYIIIRNNHNGWMTVDLFKDWFQRLLLNLIIPPNTHLIFILDKAKIHTAQDALVELKDRKDISYIFVPGGCIFLLQPLDVSINKPFKDKIRERREEWFKKEGSTKENLTKSGYFRSPPYELFTQWLVEEWGKISPELIMESFKTCGLTLKLDHSEDDKINPRIHDHLYIEKMLSQYIFKEEEAVYSEYDDLLKSLQEYEYSATYELEEPTNIQENGHNDSQEQNYDEEFDYQDCIQKESNEEEFEIEELEAPSKHIIKELDRVQNNQNKKPDLNAERIEEIISSKSSTFIINFITIFSLYFFARNYFIF